MKLVALGLAMSALAFDAPPAEACSPPPCQGGFLTPGDSARVPANLPAIHWQPMQSYDAAPDPAKVTLKTQAGAAIALTAMQQPDSSFLLVPATALAPDEIYVLADGNTCGLTGETGPTATFQTTAAAPLPTQLGTLVATAAEVGPLEVATLRGSCSSQTQSDTATVLVERTAEADPWHDVLHYQTFVDGRPWSPQSNLNSLVAPGTSWRGRGTDRIYTICSTDDGTLGEGLGEGTHVIAMHAKLPGTTSTLTATEVTVELSCSDPGDEEPGDDSGGCSTSGGDARWLALGLAVLLGRRRRARRA